MELLRRPSTLAAAAAALLVLGFVAIVASGGEGADGDAPLAGATEQATAPTDGASAGASAPDGTPAPAASGAPGDGTGGDGDPAAGVLAVPAEGEYAYASSGTWSLVGGGFDEDNQLPEAATATVTRAENTWEVRVQAGADFADTFSFATGPDGGLDWTAWALARTFRNSPSETVYDCSGDTAYYRPGEAGRTVEHACQTQDQASQGTIEQLGREELTLADGTVVQADRLSYAYTVTGGGTTAGGTEFETSGQGRLELWLDPATGLRLQEQRQIATTTTFGSGETQEYAEDITFTLRSAPPPAG